MSGGLEVAALNRMRLESHPEPEPEPVEDQLADLLARVAQLERGVADVKSDMQAMGGVVLEPAAPDTDHK